ncbi:DUF3500 domain-containing protein [Aestuariivivens sediminis]|uniref:DUF3500 domain-containing protein n=1 Tax=Aestuariivivens sediminis TaxID=2913557 RepID=UPI001F5897A6|nr:DUF3500 domain-containing protein [Aestuariivivens sediminis]
MKPYTVQFILFLTLCALSNPVCAQLTWQEQQSLKKENEGLKAPFKGITTNGTIQEGLFKLYSTGVTTEPVRNAAVAFLESLDDVQREKTKFSIDDDEWRKWMNQDYYVRQGVGFIEMSEKQRKAAFDLMGASLSAKGLKLSQDIMKLNYTLGEISGNMERYGEWRYWITIMGEPSETEPWGWQMEGHHLIINYFVLRDQVVMTPLFVGSEPVIADIGKYKGVSILQDEQDSGLKMLRALNDEQKSKAIIAPSTAGNNVLTAAWSDNVILDYAGIKASSFTRAQKDQLLLLIQLYVDHMDDGHAKVKMDEVQKYIDDTWFAWIGGSGDDAVYYYRIHSPVIIIEFDHQKPLGTKKLYGNDVHRQHIHAVVRTPNGNDYGKDLLRQHYLEHPHEHK